ncbi:Cytochrome P450-like protein 72 [Elsinoe fawcettii]|nr:Cytochrome P450-like protein 72 [Elsinoe fawcettii]
MNGYLQSEHSQIFGMMKGPSMLQGHTWNVMPVGHLVLIAVSLIFARLVTIAIYNLYFDPLSKYPGPPIAAATDLVFILQTFRGNALDWLTDLHKQYGPIVRFGPDRLSYTDPAVWKDIFGHNTANHRANPKDSRFLTGEANGHHSILSIRDDAEHGRARRIFANAFSDRALGQQEGLISRYVDQLIALIKDKIATDPSQAPTVDFVHLYNFTTFDVMGDLTYSEPLGNLTNAEYSPWVLAIYDSFKHMTLIRALNELPVLQKLWMRFMPTYLKQSAKINLEQCEQRVAKRMAIGNNTEHPDIWNLVIKGGDRFTKEELTSISILFMLAGTETTATLLSGLTYLLLKHPDKYRRLVDEVRAFKDESDLNADTTRHMKYLNACIEEGLRYYPPVPFGTPREAPDGGNTILGEFIPEKITHYPAYHSPLNFMDPDDFIPERWLLDEEGYRAYHDYDRREVVQPFSYGPRNCLGKNLAYYEMRAILARVVWNFDLELSDQSEGWLKQKSWIIWEKHPLLIRAKIGTQ